MIVRLSDQDQLSPQSRKKISVSHFLSIPFMDAALSMTVMSGLVFHNELRAIYAGRGILDRSKKMQFSGHM